MAFPAAPQPKTALGYHRILSPSAGVRVSPLCLGAMNFGEAWEAMMGKCDKKTTYEILDFFFDAGGNFIDTANNYQGEESEEWLGDWMQERKNRDQIVLATKFTTFFPSGKGGEKIKSNFQGNHSKSMKVSVEASLRKLKTDYIDLVSDWRGTFWKQHFFPDWHHTTRLRVRTHASTPHHHLKAASADSRHTALPPLVGLLDLDPRGHAIAAQPRHQRQGALPRHQRHAGMDRVAGQSVRARPRAHGLLGVPGAVERGGPRLRARHHPDGAAAGHGAGAVERARRRPVQDGGAARAAAGGPEDVPAAREGQARGGRAGPDRQDQGRAPDRRRAGLRHAQVALRLPHRRRPQGRAPEGQHRGAERRAEPRRDRRDRGRRAVRRRLPDELPVRAGWLAEVQQPDGHGRPAAREVSCPCRQHPEGPAHCAEEVVRDCTERKSFVPA